MKKSISGILPILPLISMLILALAFNIQQVKADSTTIIVPDDYATIQEAINNAGDEDTIFVKSGTYVETLVVDRSISLLGENKVTTIIDGNMAANVVSVTADNVIMSEFTIRNGGDSYAGISLSSNGNTITNNAIWNNWNGISLEHHSAYNIIAHNNITNNLNGIAGELWSDSTIIGNILKDNLLGIWIGSSKRNTIAFNNIRNHWSEGISMWQSSNNIIVGNNIMDNNQAGHWSGIVVGFSSDNQFFHNNIANKKKQIAMQGEVVNVWDDGYPSGGNYWSDYTGVDADGDGIGDIPYDIDASNQDYYPLMEPWSIPTMIKTLIRTIGFSDLPKGTENSLTSKLRNAIHLLDKENENGAIRKLMLFIDQVERMGEKKLTHDQADYLVSEAQRIIDLIRE